MAQFGTDREEQPDEYARRIQDSMDKDSWIGRDDVGASLPKGPGIVRDVSGHDKPIIYKWDK